MVNLNDYDLILGTPWLYQHQVYIGLNPARIIIGSNEVLLILQNGDSKLLLGAMSMTELDMALAKEELMRLAEPLCKCIEETELPPFRAINHTIPLLDFNKTYPWRASRCLEVFHGQWAEKMDTYLKSGHWQMTTARNTVLMLLIPKPHKPKDTLELQTVFDLCEQNKNTVKMSSLLPDIEGILCQVAAKPFRSVLDLTMAYEQIRIVSEHIEH